MGLQWQARGSRGAGLKLNVPLVLSSLVKGSGDRLHKENSMFGLGRLAVNVFRRRSNSDSRRVLVHLVWVRTPLDDWRRNDIGSSLSD